MDRDRAIDVLVRFARLVSGAGARADILPLLADAIREHAHADGVCIVEIAARGGAGVKVARGVPPGVESLAIDADAIGEELGRAVQDACSDAFAVSETRLLVAGGNLFGAVVMLFRTAIEHDFAMATADGLIDLAAITLESAAQLEKLERSNADLQSSLEVAWWARPAQ